MGGYGWKWLEMDENGQNRLERLELAETGLNLQEIAEKGQKMNGNGLQWLETDEVAGLGFKWL